MLITSCNRMRAPECVDPTWYERLPLSTNKVVTYLFDEAFLIDRETYSSFVKENDNYLYFGSYTYNYPGHHSSSSIDQKPVHVDYSFNIFTGDFDASYDYRDCHENVSDTFGMNYFNFRAVFKFYSKPDYSFDLMEYDECTSYDWYFNWDIEFDHIDSPFSDDFGQEFANQLRARVNHDIGNVMCEVLRKIVPLSSYKLFLK